MSTHDTQWTYTVYDTVEAHDESYYYNKYLSEGMESCYAYNKAIEDARKDLFSARKHLHVITDEEKKSIPKSVLNKPNGVGKYFWRAPAFQYMDCSGFYDLETQPMASIALIVLGNLQKGDRVPFRMKPRTISGYDMEYLTFEKYSHKFPSGKYYIHTETLNFIDSEGKAVRFQNMPTVYYGNKVWDKIQGLASILSYWNMCRLNNEESMFLDLFKILQRERILGWKRDIGFTIDNDRDFSVPSIWEQPRCMFKTL